MGSTTPSVDTRVVEEVSYHKTRADFESRAQRAWLETLEQCQGSQCQGVEVYVWRPGDLGGMLARLQLASCDR